MKRIIDVILQNILLGLILASSLLIIFLSAIGFDKEPFLHGVTIEQKQCDANVNTIMKGDYQQFLENSYLNQFALRNYFVKAYNEILFQIKATNNGIICGKDGYLFGKGDVQVFSGDAVTVWSEEVYQQFAINIKTIQDYLQEQGKGFVYIISPNKTEIYEDKLPFRIYKGRNKAQSNHYKLKKALEENNVIFVDAENIMNTLRSEGEIAFYKAGHHWSELAAMRTAKQAFSLIEENVPQVKEIDYSVEISAAPLGADNDLYLLNNIYSPQPLERYYNIKALWAQETEKNRKLCLLGTSFSGQLTDLYGNNAVFDNIIYYSYLSWGYKIQDGKTTSVEVSPNVNENNLEMLLSDNDIIVFETNSSVLMQSHLEIAQYLADFVTQ